MSDDGLQDFFADEPNHGHWDRNFRRGEMLMKALADLPNFARSLAAVRRLPREDLELVVMERLYIWHATSRPGPEGYRAMQRWMLPEDTEADS